MLTVAFLLLGLSTSLASGLLNILNVDANVGTTHCHVSDVQLLSHYTHPTVFRNKCLPLIFNENKEVNEWSKLKPWGFTCEVKVFKRTGKYRAYVYPTGFVNNNLLQLDCDYQTQFTVEFYKSSSNHRFEKQLLGSTQTVRTLRKQTAAPIFQGTIEDENEGTAEIAADGDNSADSGAVDDAEHEEETIESSLPLAAESNAADATVTDTTPESPASNTHVRVHSKEHLNCKECEKLQNLALGMEADFDNYLEENKDGNIKVDDSGEVQPAAIGQSQHPVVEENQLLMDFDSETNSETYNTRAKAEIRNGASVHSLPRKRKADVMSAEDSEDFAAGFMDTDSIELENDEWKRRRVEESQWNSFEEYWTQQTEELRLEKLGACKGCHSQLPKSDLIAPSLQCQRCLDLRRFPVATGYCMGAECQSVRRSLTLQRLSERLLCGVCHYST